MSMILKIFEEMATGEKYVVSDVNGGKLTVHSYRDLWGFGMGETVEFPWGTRFRVEETTAAGHILDRYRYTVPREP